MAIITKISRIAATLSISMNEKLPRFLLPIWSVIFRPLCSRTKQQSGAIFANEEWLLDPVMLLRYCHSIRGPAMVITASRAW
jgi:hypothetical protein